ELVELRHECGPGIPHWREFPDETRKTVYWYEKRPDTMGNACVLRGVHACRSMGDARRSAGAFCKRIAHSGPDRSQGNAFAAGSYRRARRGSEESRLHVDSGAS